MPGDRRRAGPRRTVPGGSGVYVRLIESCVRDKASGTRVSTAPVPPEGVRRAGTSRESGGTSASWTGWACFPALAGRGASLAQEPMDAGPPGLWAAGVAQESLEACAAAVSCPPGRGVAAEAGPAEKTGPDGEKFVAHIKERARAIRISSAGTGGTGPCPASRRLEGPAWWADVTAGPPVGEAKPACPQDQPGGLVWPQGNERKGADRKSPSAYNRASNFPYSGGSVAGGATGGLVVPTGCAAP